MKNMGASPEGDRAAGLRPQPPEESSHSSIPCAECERLREEIADYMGHRTDNVAGKVWAARHLFSRFEDQLEDLIGEFEKLGHDDYDQSLEIYGVPEDVRLGEDAQRLIRDAGFHKVYVNHPGERETRWETHYTFDGELPVRGWRRQHSEKGFNISYWPEGWDGPGCADWLSSGYMTIVPDPLDPFASGIETRRAADSEAGVAAKP